MATYYHGNTEIQGSGDGLQTLILMNPAYVGFSDNHHPQPPPNFVFLNSNSATVSLPHPPPSQIQHFAAAATSASGASPQEHQDVSELHGGSLPRLNYNFYNSPINTAAAREVTRAKQGLSLSLSSHQHMEFGSFRPETVDPVTSEDIRVSVNGVQSGLLSSKFLKAAKEILDEVVYIGKDVKNATVSSAKKENGETMNSGESSEAAAAGDGESEGGDGVSKRGAELTTAEKQEIQMKKAKLVNMLDEVEQRYKQYHHQMQMVISWFEQLAGIGSAKTYTALALQTISKQFRCLKDAILGQIRVASKNLGEDQGSLGSGKIEGSRLKYVDNQIRQQRALQQLGMIQHNAWRPQRGLPERSVSVLRAWLFEHFLHPYPKDSDKVMLAKQAGLTRSQVSNWFINARVRLWKPMVEEMYAEEMKEHKGNGSDIKTAKTEQNEVSTSKSTANSQAKSPQTKIQNKSFASKLDNNLDRNIVSAACISTTSTSPTEATMRNNNVGFTLIGSSQMESITQGSPKKPRINADMSHFTNTESKPNNVGNEHVLMKFGDEGQSREAFTITGQPTNFVGGFGSYPIVELGLEQFQAPYSGNGTVSLTLGLPHCENIAMSGAHQTFLANQNMQLGRSLEIGEANDFNGMNAATSAQSVSVYENIDIQNRKRFAARFLSDFVT